MVQANPNYIACLPQPMLCRRSFRVPTQTQRNANVHLFEISPFIVTHPPCQLPFDHTLIMSTVL